jgi:hypothetical protein
MPPSRFRTDLYVHLLESYNHCWNLIRSGHITPKDIDDVRCEECGLLTFGESPTFRKTIAPPSSGLKCKPIWRLYVPPKRCALSELHGVTTQKTVLFRVTRRENLKSNNFPFVPLNVHVHKCCSWELVRSYVMSCIHVFSQRTVPLSFVWCTEFAERTRTKLQFDNKFQYSRKF